MHSSGHFDKLCFVLDIFSQDFNFFLFYLLFQTTAYMPELQKLCGDQAVKDAGKPSKGI